MVTKLEFPTEYGVGAIPKGTILEVTVRPSVCTDGHSFKTQKNCEAHAILPECFLSVALDNTFALCVEGKFMQSQGYDDFAIHYLSPFNPVNGTLTFFTKFYFRDKYPIVSDFDVEVGILTGKNAKKAEELRDILIQADDNSAACKGTLFSTLFQLQEWKDDLHYIPLYYSKIDAVKLFNEMMRRVYHMNIYNFNNEYHFKMEIPIYYDAYYANLNLYVENASIAFMVMVSYRYKISSITAPEDYNIIIPTTSTITVTYDSYQENEHIYSYYVTKAWAFDFTQMPQISFVRKDTGQKVMISNSHTDSEFANLIQMMIPPFFTIFASENVIQFGFVDSYFVDTIPRTIKFFITLPHGVLDDERCILQLHNPSYVSGYNFTCQTLESHSMYIANVWDDGTPKPSQRPFVFNLPLFYPFNFDGNIPFQINIMYDDKQVVNTSYTIDNSQILNQIQPAYYNTTTTTTTSATTTTTTTTTTTFATTTNSYSYTSSTLDEYCLFGFGLTEIAQTQKYSGYEYSISTRVAECSRPWKPVVRQSQIDFITIQSLSAPYNITYFNKSCLVPFSGTNSVDEFCNREAIYGAFTIVFHWKIINLYYNTNQNQQFNEINNSFCNNEWLECHILKFQSPNRLQDILKTKILMPFQQNQILRKIAVKNEGNIAEVDFIISTLLDFFNELYLKKKIIPSVSSASSIVVVPYNVAIKQKQMFDTLQLNDLTIHTHNFHKFLSSDIMVFHVIGVIPSTLMIENQALQNSVYMVPAYDVFNDKRLVFVSFTYLKLNTNDGSNEFIDLAIQNLLQTHIPQYMQSLQLLNLCVIPNISNIVEPLSDSSINLELNYNGLNIANVELPIRKRSNLPQQNITTNVHCPSLNNFKKVFDTQEASVAAGFDKNVLSQTSLFTFIVTLWILSAMLFI